MFLENKRTITVWYITALVLISTGVIAGALYYAYNFLGTAEIKNYLDGYMNSLRNGMDFTGIIKKSLKSNTLLFCIIAVTSLFKY